MPDPEPGPDPWRVVVELVAAADSAAATHPDLNARLDELSARFGGRGDTVAELLDQLDQRTTIDVEAPVASSRPVVPSVKRAVRKANAFVSRHLAQQITVVAGGLAAVARQLDDRLRRLEAAQDPTAAAALVPDLSARFADHLGALAGNPSRTVRTWSELSTLPAGDASLLVVTQLGDVVTAPDRLLLIDTLLGGLAAGGHLAVVGIDPASWPALAGPLAADLAPGRPIHAATWAHLLQEQGATVTAQHESEGAYLVVARS